MKSSIIFSVTLGLATLNAQGAQGKLRFNRDIRPLMSDTCFHCHGPDAKARKAELRLDIREEALKPAKSGAVPIVPGKPGESEVVKRLFTSDKDDLMPPEESHKTFTQEQKEIFRRWIAEGAEYEAHWSFIKPVKAAVPAAANPIDHLVRQRLQSLGLQMSPEADRRTLARRLSMDLVGLPPKPEDVDAFTADTSVDACEKFVEKLLASPHYGERMAIGWLDVVRYADTAGYHSDNPRNVAPYRDWVIAAFNHNKRYDRMTLEQIAGDLMPDASLETRVGSAFNRLLLSTEEGGAQAKDYEARMLGDRVRAVGAVWLGQTLGCCQCHDHKFDPATQRDFYSMGAFFADINESILGRREEGILVAPHQDEAKLKEFDDLLADAKRKLEDLRKEMEGPLKQWGADVLSDKIVLPELAADSKAGEPDKKRALQVVALLKKENSKIQPKEQEIIEKYFFEKVDTKYEAGRKMLAESKRQRDEFYKPLPKCIVTTHTNSLRTVRILPRGNWQDETGEIVKPALPAYLAHDAKAERDLTRLDLAKWLVSREHPLTARVFVNRLWKQFFGMGLSKVIDDLGAQGELPPNQELLDWLACEFMDSGWDVKHLVRLMVTSATYKESSNASHEMLARDPYNRELARQSRFRVDAELVRDNALAISGLLNPKIGGPSVKPYQPPGYWENLNFPTREWENDKNENQWRRGLYTWWQRSYLHPAMAAFDAPSREESCADRNRSNIPQQALVLLNDPTFVEAARAFATRIIQQGGDANARLAWAWRQALSRAPRSDELETMKALLNKHLDEFTKDEAAAALLVKTGISPVKPEIKAAELAAWTNAARVILNLHETVTRY